MIMYVLAIEVGAIHELPLPRSIIIGRADRLLLKVCNYSVGRAYSLTNMVTKISTL
jgi:hypothetical protein